MSTFAVTLNRIEKIWPHPNADRLSLACMEGMSYQFCVLKDEFKPGDEVLYFPPDSVLPAGVIEQLGLTGRLAGKDKNRIKTLKLRGAISQGIVCRPGLFFGMVEGKQWIPQDITKELGVTKYDPPPIPCHAGNLVHLPNGISAYDIEGADRFPHIVDLLLDQPVCITEKIEGCNYWVSLDEKDVLEIGQRHDKIVPIEEAEHDFFKAARLQNLEAAMRSLRPLWPNGRITLRGEFIGPGMQDNIYGLKQHEVMFYDIEVNMTYIGSEEFFKVVPQGLPCGFPSSSTPTCSP
jgi:RNA ligase (TIGR02306 family)